MYNKNKNDILSAEELAECRKIFVTTPFNVSAVTAVVTIADVRKRMVRLYEDWCGLNVWNRSDD